MEFIDGLRWRKSSYTGNGGANCVEVARGLAGAVAVRDSKDADGSVLVFAPDDWRTFMVSMKAGEFALG
jgi:hypothetical protein